ncbi:MAG: GreA/GreB family elongation factor [Methylotenera sp.]|nr:GreA/GreB family elongation factor [Oligoflexia bacterium]
MTATATLDKAKILEILQKKIEGELQAIIRSATLAHQEATHEESKAEDQYDTRGLEASYLAGAQAQRATELQQLLVTLKYLPLHAFKSADAIAASALVLLETGESSLYYWLITGAGGLSVVWEGLKIQMISPSSPMGEELIGRKAGDAFEMQGKGGVREYEILEVF